LGVFSVVDIGAVVVVCRFADKEEREEGRSEGGIVL